MKTFLMVAASLTMVAAGLGVLASIPAQSIPLAGASVFAFLLGGILYALADISITLAAASPADTTRERRIAEPTPEQIASSRQANRRRMAMAVVVLLVAAVCVAYSVTR